VAGVTRATVDLVEHPGRVGEIEEAVLGERRRHHVLVGRDAAERNRVGDLQSLGGIAVDAGERREALPVISAMIHQPVLRFLVGIDEPLRRHVGRVCGPRHHGGGEQNAADRMIAHCHEIPPKIDDHR
jgi:hypothetical protein